MCTVTVSSKYQVVIPREVRESLKLRPGHKLAMFNVGGHVRMVPVLTMKSMRGFLKGMGTELERDEDRL
jgi:AbrB family looped-hinge helix DNA binding protein